MQTGEKVQIEHHRWLEREKKGAEKEEEGVWEKASGERRSVLFIIMNQVDFQQGLFSFCCILLNTWVVWSCVFQPLSGTKKKNTIIIIISVIFNSIQTCINTKNYWK